MFHRVRQEVSLLNAGRGRKVINCLARRLPMVTRACNAGNGIVGGPGTMYRALSNRKGRPG
ncbi:hypothetical protein GF325_07330 [Candidatus Bathyarchaeota archaeon]|nr:hypothetical protein [Candidatus Bathyarchaeota archaeon]